MNTRPSAPPQRIVPGEATAWLHDARASRDIEAAALARHAAHALMQRAGLAVARLALAVAPHARRVWIACGPGNNGGDGLIAARHLLRAGLGLHVTLCGDAARLPEDARRALDEATQAGVTLSAGWPETPVHLVIDALLGLGAARAPQGAIAEAIAAIGTQRGAAVLAVDLPSGLHADTGQRLGGVTVRATHTLSLLTLKPGLFTGAGRDHAGQVWLDDLGVACAADSATAQLAGAAAMDVLLPRAHASHKGSYGDVAVVGGAAGMTGAALLAARAALASGAGRVFVGLLDRSAWACDALRPELMFRPQWWRSEAATLAHTTVVCGCGGGDAVREALPPLLHHGARLVLDADALNAIAADRGLRQALCSRGARGLATVLTPHPLEAARLLGGDTGSVQADRLRAATALARELNCVVLLKGSGSVIAAPQTRPVLNPSGNALLAGGGTGDVLAGWVGGLWAQLAAARSEPPAAVVDGSAHAAHGSRAAWQAAWQAACAATWLHGHAADRQLATAECTPGLRAGDLVERMRELAAVRRASPPARQP